MSFSYVTSDSFTLANARKLAAKVVADMHQCSHFYGKPSDANIKRYNEELTILLAGGYVDTYEFGYKKNGKRVISWFYEVADGDLEGGRAGGVLANVNVSDATPFNFLSYSASWFQLSPTTQNAIHSKHSVDRDTGDPPSDGAGSWSADRAYGSGGVQLNRKVFKPW